MSLSPHLARRDQAWFARLLLVIVLCVLSSHLLAASYLPFRSRLPESVTAQPARLYALSCVGGAILLAVSWRFPYLITGIYVVFLAGLLLLTLGKNLRELARNPNPFGTEHPLLHQPDDDGLRALLDASNMHGSTTYLTFYEKYQDATLIAPQTLLDTINLRKGRLVWWGGLEAVTLRDYDPALDAEQIATLRAQPHTTWTAYDGRDYLLVEGTGDIWLALADETVVVIPTALIPAPEVAP